MKIDVNSWHYQLTNFIGGGNYRPKNLCAYFWAVVGSTLLTLVFALFLVLGAGCVIAFLVMIIDTTLKYPAEALPVFAFVYLVGVGIYAYSLRGISYKTHKEPGLLIAYVIAKKKKFCPMIELVNSKE